jgi:hypothetical protein
VEPPFEPVVVASNEALFVGARVVEDIVVVPDVAGVAPQSPPPRPPADVSIGGHLTQHFTTPTFGCVALSAEHDHSEAVFL